MDIIDVAVARVYTHAHACNLINEKIINEKIINKKIVIKPIII